MKQFIFLTFLVLYGCGGYAELNFLDLVTGSSISKSIATGMETLTGQPSAATQQRIRQQAHETAAGKQEKVFAECMEKDSASPTERL